MNRTVLSICALALAPVPPLAAQEAATRDDAQAAYVAGELSQARAIVEALLIASPQDPDLIRRLAMIEAGEGELDKAQSTIDRALELAPEDADIQLARANILLWRGKLAQAERQADAVRAARPGYPGLAEFDRAAERSRQARQFRLLAVGIGQSFSETELQSGASQSWSSQSAYATFGKVDDLRANIGIEREERLAVDTRATLRLDFGDDGQRFFLSGSVTPNADFRERWSLAAGGDFAVGSRTELLVDARFADYRDSEIFVLRPGLRHHFGDRVTVTAHTINLLGGGEDYRIGAALRGDLGLKGGGGLYASLASYPDTEADGTRQLRSVAVGSFFPITDRLTARIAGEYESRKESYDRTAVMLGLGWSFGPL